VCTKIWSRGQLVHRDYYDRYGGDSAPNDPSKTPPDNEPGGGLPMPQWP
jgi:hypothetical protein